MEIESFTQIFLLFDADRQKVCFNYSNQKLVDKRNIPFADDSLFTNCETAKIAVNMQKPSTWF